MPNPVELVDMNLTIALTATWILLLFIALLKILERVLENILRSAEDYVGDELCEEGLNFLMEICRNLSCWIMNFHFLIYFLNDILNQV